MGVATADLDAHRPGPAAAPRAGRHPGLGDPAERRRLAEDLAVAGRPPEADADLREAPALLGLRLSVVRRHLHPADDLAGRLHHPAAVRLLAGAPRPAARRAPQPGPAAGAHVVRVLGARCRRPRAGPDGAEGQGLPGPGLDRLDRRRRRGLGGGRARVPPRGRQPAVPPGRRVRARGLRHGRAVRLQGRRHPGRGQRLHQRPDAVRRLRPGLALRRLLDGALLVQGRPVRRRLDRLRAAAGDGAGLQRAPDLPRRPRRRRSTPTTCG